MYWFYLIIFILAVFVPDLINREFYFLGEERVEELAIFLLGTIGFLFFIIREKQLSLNVAEKTKIQKEAFRISKDLTDSYSYIGETNRKLDILKNIILEIPESSVISKKEEEKIYASIMEAVHILTKAKRFSLRFFDLNSRNTLKEIKSGKGPNINVENSYIIAAKKKILKDKDFTIIVSPEKIDKIKCCIIIPHEKREQELDDPELIEALASRALLFFALSRKKKKK